MVFLLRFVFAAGILGSCVFALGACAPGVCGAATVDLVISRITGEISLHNPNELPFGLVAYTISSTVDALDGSDFVWTSIADTYDASGDQSVDMDDEWVEFSIPLPGFSLGEGEFLGDGGILAPDQTVSLGFVWDPQTDLETLSAEVIDADSQFATVNLDFRSFDGDYDNDLDVDADDYTVWKNSFGSTLDLDADGNRDGVVDAADYTVWRDNLGAAFAPAVGIALSLNASQAVPEPTSFTLLVLGWGALFLTRQGRRSACPFL